MLPLVVECVNRWSSTTSLKSSAVFLCFQNEIKEHSFFSSINWDDLLQKKVPPPFTPKVVSVPYYVICMLFIFYLINVFQYNHGLFLFLQNSFSDISNFDPEFTDEMVPNSVCWPEHSIVNASVMEADDAFVGFSYAPPSDDSFQ